MFNLQKHQSEYFYNYVTVINKIIPESITNELKQRCFNLIKDGKIPLVDHNGFGTDATSDLGGAYLHHIFQGDDIRKFLPELNAIYHAILPLMSLVTSTNTIVSPYPLSDINIKAYPKVGGTLGLHYDTNGITALLSLTNNSDSPLRMHINRKHPSKKEPWVEIKDVYAQAGDLILLQGREVLHESIPTVSSAKLSVLYNFYVEGDTYRHEDFDNFVYYGIKPKTL